MVIEYMLAALAPFMLDTSFGLAYYKNIQIIRKNLRYVIAFASGLVISAAFFELLPHANISGEWFESNILFVALGFISFYVIEKLTLLHSCGEEECEVHTLGSITALGLAADNIVDGIGIVTGFLIDPILGIVITIAVVAHEIPQAISASVLLKNSNVKNTRGFLILFLGGLFYLIGAIIANFIPEEFYHAVIALVAGVFLYIGAGDLLSEAHKRFNLMVIASVILGFITIILITSLEIIVGAH
jgi:zinc and cadmium transporter